MAAKTEEERIEALEARLKSIEARQMAAREANRVQFAQINGMLEQLLRHRKKKSNSKKASDSSTNERSSLKTDSKKKGESNYEFEFREFPELEVFVDRVSINSTPFTISKTITAIQDRSKFTVWKTGVSDESQETDQGMENKNKNSLPASTDVSCDAIPVVSQERADDPIDGQFATISTPLTSQSKKSISRPNKAVPVVVGRRFRAHTDSCRFKSTSLPSDSRNPMELDFSSWVFDRGRRIPFTHRRLTVSGHASPFTVVNYSNPDSPVSPEKNLSPGYVDVPRNEKGVEGAQSAAELLGKRPREEEEQNGRMLYRRIRRGDVVANGRPLARLDRCSSASCSVGYALPDSVWLLGWSCIFQKLVSESFSEWPLDVIKNQKDKNREAFSVAMFLLYLLHKDEDAVVGALKQSLRQLELSFPSQDYRLVSHCCNQVRRTYLGTLTMLCFRSSRFLFDRGKSREFVLEVKDILEGPGNDAIEPIKYYKTASAAGVYRL